MSGNSGLAGSAVLDDGPRELADDFWFLCHDNVSGALRLHVRTRDYGLAACLLGELLLCGVIGIDTAVVTAVDKRPAAPADLTTRPNPPTPDLREMIWRRIVAEPWRHPVRSWLTVLGQAAEAQVVDRLATAGYLRVQRTFRGVRAEPANWNVAGWPAARLRTSLEHQRYMSKQDLLLLALVEATGLTAPVFNGVPAPVRVSHRQLLNHIAHQYPEFADLAEHTRTAVASATLIRGHG